MSQLTESVGERAIARTSHTSFFFAMSGAFLAIVLIGFAPTFYLHGVFFPTPTRPAYVYVHGFVMTAWFLLLFIQTGLIRTGHFQRHRQLGVAGAFLGLGVVIMGVTVAVGVVPGLKGIPGFDFASDISVLGLGSGETVARFVSFIVWANLATAVTFSVLLVSAILFRRQPETHKRLMLMASLAVLGPAISRISRWPGLGGETGPFFPTVFFFLLAVIVVHDVAVTKRVRPFIFFGGSLVVFDYFAAKFVAATEFGQSFVMGL